MRREISWKKNMLMLIIFAGIIFILIPTIFSLVKLKNNNKDVNVYDSYTDRFKEQKIFSLMDAIYLSNSINESENFDVSINDNKDITYENTITIKILIDNMEQQYIVKINNQEYNITRNETEIATKVTEGTNKIHISIYSKDKVLIKEYSKDIYMIKKYNHQYLEELNNSGISTHFDYGFDNDKTLELLKNMGVRVIRDDITWANIEDKNGNYNFTWYDKWINKINENGIQIIAILNNPGDLFGKDKKVSSDEEIERFKKFASVFMNRYKFITKYEILNEINLSYYTADDLYYYSKLVNEVEKEAYKINPQIEILSCSAGQIELDERTRTSSTTLIKNVLNMNYRNKNNLISIHQYDDTENGNWLEQRLIIHKKLLNDYGGFINIGLLETGASSFGEITEETQENRIIKYLIEAQENNYKYRVVYNSKNINNDRNNKEENYGIIYNNDTPKNTYYALKNFFEKTNGAEFIGKINNEKDEIKEYVFDKNGQPMIVSFNKYDNKTEEKKYNSTMITNVYGNPNENEKGKVKITSSPIYIQSEDTNYFYQAISNSITEGYSDFNSKFKDEISKVNGLSNKINSLNQTASSLKNMSTLDENTANNLMKSHFELGNDLINAYNNGSLNVEYVKLSSMLDSLNTIGNSYEDLVTVSAKTRMNDLTDITNEVNNANSIIENNGKLDIVYPEKIYKFSKDLLDTSSYVLGLEEENDIKTGLINSKALHAKYLANWSQEFSQSYINDKLKKPINKIIADNEVIINNTSNGISKNSDILNSYATLKNNLNNLIKNETENNLDKLNNAYTNQMSLIKLVVSKYNLNEIRINDNIYKLMIENFINLSDDYKELYELYKTDSDIISTKEVEETLNKVINRYNDNKDSTNDFSNETDIINNMTELFNGLFDRTQDSVIEVQSAENYLKKQRILKTCDIASSMLENDIKQKADVEYKAITISSDKGINNFTNQDETITINLPKNAQITSESSNGFKFNDNGTKDVKLSIRGYDYTYTIKVNNIDKTLPKVTAQNGQSIKINAIDDNLKEIKIEKDGKETAVNNGQTITTPGIYKIIATDKAGNSANETAIVYGTYTNEQNSQVNYVTIKSKTKVRDIKQDVDYTIKDNNNIANEIKRAPSSVNTNAEKDSNSYIATGDILQDNNNTYIVITLGDLSGNGDVGVADIIKLRKSLVGLTKLNKLQELAADTNQNGSVNVSDLLKERKIMVGME